MNARELDDAFLGIVADWSRGGPGCDEMRFDRLALATFAYQLETNEPYARFARTRGYDPGRLPASWREIPPVPAGAFKDATLATFDVSYAEAEFHTSGTSAGGSGKHYLERAALYDASLLAGFDRFVLADRAKLRYLNLVPNPRLRKHSSLGYMMGHVSVLRGDGKAGYFLDDEHADAAGLDAALNAAIAEGQPLCLTGTAFAFVAVLDAFAQAQRRFALPAGSRLIETGGFKGRTRTVSRDELYAALALTFGVPESSIIAEYGMTELLSQYYDAPDARAASTRRKVAPPWLRTLVVDGTSREVAEGERGFLQHVDLANRSSAVAVLTEDRGYRAGSGLVLLGRESDAAARGCSLDAEALLARR